MVLRSIVLAAALLAASSLAADRLLLSSEADLTWKYRVLLLAGDNSGDRIAILRAHRKAIEERDLIWFLFKGDEIVTNSVRALSPSLSESLRTRVADARGNVVLVGKDGGVKLETDEIDLPTIFARIDAMPMRRREMEY